MGPWGPWPQQPPQPPGPSQPPPRHGNKRILLVVGAVVVALGLVVAGGIGVYVGFVDRMMKGIQPISADPLDNDPAKDWQPGPGAVLNGKVAWSDTFVENDPFDAHPIGYWLTDSTFVRGSHSRLVAYQRKSGQKVWQLDAPKDRKFCGMTTSTDGRTGALALDVESTKRSELTKLPERVCKDVQLVDLSSGQARWTTNFPAKTATGTPSSAVLELVGNVVIFQSDADGFGVEVTTGKRLWSTQKLKRGEYDCTPQDLMPDPTAGHFVGLWRCGFGAATTMFTGIVAPASGRIGQVADLPKGSIDPSWAGGIGIASTEPTVVVIPSTSGTDTEGKGRIVVLDAAGKPTLSIPQTGSYGTLDLTATGSSTDVAVPDAGRDRFRMAVVDGRTLYATTVLGVSQSGQENVVVAFDLATGKPRWTGKAGNGDTVKVVGADKDGAIAMSAGTYQDPPQVLRYAAADGKRAELGPPYPRDYISTPILTWMIWADNQVIMVPWKELPSVIGAPPPSSVWAFG
ncbi:outer membrane protein assembly factor BamB family protein [Tenggerimyces flavus]|uniref:PQQ-binding-like beta-propeller repeat protein n=1 Tax=Tenggerimyces flavus TaxID=1708749 RepID=A0ABV7Y503_9ACTN|nr:PQQ-binding-like beta-propeller repeat protein [Tenggerimyces flavus]MBM7788560.1 hypothetical protein [Tenggerimyces flavus]